MNLNIVFLKGNGGVLVRRPLAGFSILFIIGLVIASNFFREDNTILCLLLGGGCIYVFQVFQKKNVKYFLFLYIAYLFGFAYWNFYSSLYQEDVPIEIDFNHPYQVTGKVEEIISSRDSEYSLVLKLSSIERNEKITETKCILLAYVDEGEFDVGDIILASGTISLPHEKRNPGGFDEKKYTESFHAQYIFQGKVNRVITDQKFSWKRLMRKAKRSFEKVYYTALPEKEASVLTDILLGSNNMTDMQKERYRQVGISHILAISGLHISLIGGSLIIFLRFFPINKKLRSCMVIGMLIFYCLFTGGSVSTVRATVMMGVVLGAGLVGRRQDIWTTILFSAFLLLTYDPTNLYFVGFQLTFMAVFGLLIVTPVLERNYWIPKIFRKPLAASMGVTLSISPIVAYYFYTIPLYSVLVNLIIIPFLPLIIIFGFVAGVLGLFSLYGSQFFIGIVYFILNLYDKIISVSDGLPNHSILLGQPKIFSLILYYGFLLFFCMYYSFSQNTRSKYKKIQPFIYGIMIGLLILKMFWPQPLTVTYLDVGQGDSIFIQSPDGQTMLIDGGGNITAEDKNTGRYVLIPYLEWRGIGCVDAVCLTHEDGDHILGLIEVVEEMEVHRIFVPDVSMKEHNEYYHQLMALADQKEITVTPLGDKDEIQMGQVRFTCLHPLQKSYENTNATSVVLHMQYGKADFLFVGDIGSEEEKNIVRRHPILNIDVLKVPHHGSRFSSSSSFISHIDPQIAVISCGVNNHFGHPHPEVLKRYEEQGVVVYTTASYGAITIETKDDTLKIETELNKVIR